VANPIVQNLQPTQRLNPTASPTNTYVQPGQGNTQDFLRALGTLNPVLDQFAQRLSDQDRVKQEASAERKIGGMTYEESRAAVKAGELPEFASPWFRAAFEKQTGIRMANEVRRKAEAELATMDVTTADPEALVATFVEEANAEIDGSGSQFLAAGFSSALDGVGEKVRDAVNSARIKRTVEVRDANAYENGLGLVERFTQTGPDGQPVVGDGRALLTSYRLEMQANRDTLGMSYADQDKITARIIQTLAQRPGMEDVIRQLGSLDRDAGIAVSSKMGPQFDTLLLQAQAATERQQNDAIQPQIADWTIRADSGDATQFDEKAFDAFAAANPTILTGSFVASIKLRYKNAVEQAAAKASAALASTAKDTVITGATPRLVNLARTGLIAEVVGDTTVEVNGRSVTLTQTEMREIGLRGAAEQIVAEGTAQKLSPERIRANVIGLYGQNGEVDPVAKSRIIAAVQASVVPGDVSETLLQYLPEIRAVASESPEMLHLIVPDERSRMFLEAIDVGLDTGLGEREAIRAAEFRRQNYDTLARPEPAVMKSLVASVKGKLGGGPAAEALGRTIEARVRYYAATGVTGDALVKRARDSILARSVKIGNAYVDISGTGVAPTRAQPVFEEAVDALQEARPEFKGAIGWVAMSEGSKQFMAVDAMRNPIPGSTRTWDELSSMYDSRRAARLKAEADRKAKGKPTTLGTMMVSPSLMF
jgi:hypothetical protein